MSRILQRRRTRKLAVWNAAIWSVGNGLASATLIIYLADELHSKQFGLSIGLILAAPQLVGLLRLGAPAMIGRLGNRKQFCIANFALAAVTLGALPLVCAPGRLPSPGWSVGMLAALWSLFHLFQYLATVALWSWLADAARLAIRGRFFGVRERWGVAGTAVAALAGGLAVWLSQQWWPHLAGWILFAAMAGLGAAFMLAAVFPLALMPADLHPRFRRGDSPASSVCTPVSWRAILKPFADERFQRLLLFGCWFSFFNGFTQSAQSFFPKRVLGISLFTALAVQTGTRLGQWGVSPWLGAVADRRGNRPVMIVCQLLVAAGLLPLAIATPGCWQWYLVAWALWIAYAGMNVCLPNLMLKCAPDESNTPYIAAYYALGGLCYAASTIAGGALVDHYQFQVGLFGDDALPWFFAGLFLFGWVARSCGALILALVVREPAASTDLN